MSLSQQRGISNDVNPDPTRISFRRLRRSRLRLFNTFNTRVFNNRSLNQHFKIFTLLFPMPAIKVFQFKKYWMIPINKRQLKIDTV